MKTVRLGISLSMLLLLSQTIGAAEGDDPKVAAAREEYTKELEVASGVFAKAGIRARGRLLKTMEYAAKDAERKKDTVKAEAIRKEMKDLADAPLILQPAKPPGHADLMQQIGPELVYADKTRKPTELLAKPDYVILYLSAHWCPPCRKFTPELVRQYRELKKSGANVEVVFVSQDEDVEHQFGYMKELGMPWPAAPFPKAEALTKKYGGGRGIPNVIVLDRDDKVVSQSYAGERYLGPQNPIDDLKQLLK